MSVCLRGLALLALVPVLALIGCGSSSVPTALGEYVDVKGMVQLNGKPLKTGTIYFKKDGDAGRDEFVDVKDGTFALKMFVAKYKVAFDTDSKKSSVSAKYKNFATTDLSLEVKAGGVTDAAFNVK